MAKTMKMSLNSLFTMLSLTGYHLAPSMGMGHSQTKLPRSLGHPHPHCHQVLLGQPLEPIPTHTRHSTGNVASLSAMPRIPHTRATSQMNESFMHMLRECAQACDSPSNQDLCLKVLEKASSHYHYCPGLKQPYWPGFGTCPPLYLRWHHLSIRFCLRWHHPSRRLHRGQDHLGPLPWDATLIWTLAQKGPCLTSPHASPPFLHSAVCLFPTRWYTGCWALFSTYLRHPTLLAMGNGPHHMPAQMHSGKTRRVQAQSLSCNPAASGSTLGYHTFKLGLPHFASEYVSACPSKVPTSLSCLSVQYLFYEKFWKTDSYMGSSSPAPESKTLQAKRKQTQSGWLCQRALHTPFVNTSTRRDGFIMLRGRSRSSRLSRLLWPLPF